jgi:hypothetical protein
MLRGSHHWRPHEPSSLFLFLLRQQVGVLHSAQRPTAAPSGPGKALRQAWHGAAGYVAVAACGWPCGPNPDWLPDAVNERSFLTRTLADGRNGIAPTCIK